MAEDWRAVFEFEDPVERQHAQADEFAAWCRENEPLRVLSFTIHDASCEGAMGWVPIESQTQMRRFPAVSPRTTRTWEKWRWEASDWYPVPKSMLDNYPASPAERDLTEEPRLRARFDASWAARQHSDWDTLYGLGDPRDHADVSLSALANAYAQFRYVSARVQWVEVIADRGRVRVLLDYVLNDPSLAKMSLDTVVFSERWIKYENEWFLDLVTHAE